jgi:hypothetical protein
MNATDRPYRQVATAQGWILAAIGVLALCTLALLTERGVDLAFGVAVTVALALLLTHSVEIRVDAHEVEIRMGNGWRRIRVQLDEIEDWRVDPDARVWGAGRRDPDGHRRFGLGAPQGLLLHTRGGDLTVGLVDAGEAAAAIDRQRRARLDAGVDEEPR